MNSFYRDLAKGLRRLTFLLVATLLFATLALRGERLEDLPKPTDYVSDYAHVLSPQGIAQVDAICGQLDHSAASAQVAVVTIHTLGGEDRDDYVSRLYHQMGIGKKGSDRGVLIFLAVDDHQRRIEVGYGLEGILPDGKVGDIGREMVPYLRQQDYDGAVLTAVRQVGQVIADDAKVSLQEPAEQPSQQSQPGRHVVHHGNPLGGFLFLLILLMVFGGSWIFRLLFGFGLLSSLFRGGGGGWGGGGWGGGSWGSGGGWGGGDGGGGFGGFGGGDSGGGGAGGSW